MAKNDQSNQLNLTVVALVALVAIVGLVALVMNAASVTKMATGSKLVSAQDAVQQPVQQRPAQVPPPAEQNAAGQGVVWDD